MILFDCVIKNVVNNDGILHCTDGPAVVYSSGNKLWYINGKLHRTDGPAVEYANGDKAWHINGQLHRIDGPAVEHHNGYKAWWLNDKRLTEEEFIAATKPQESIMTIDEDGDKEWRNADGKLHRIDGPAIEDTNGDKAWFVEGKRHRTDGPAIENTNGDKVWYVNGQLHRLDGPAIESTSGYKAWWINDKPHRLDGPAIEYTSGSKAWYIHGKQLSEEEFKAITKSQESTMVVNEDGRYHRAAVTIPIEILNSSEALYLTGKRHRQNGLDINLVNNYKKWWLNHNQLTEEQFKAINILPESIMNVNQHGDKEWRNASGKLHRLDGPAIEYASGSKAWHINDQLHRIDGPAIEFVDGSKEWYIHGKKLTEEEFKAATKPQESTMVVDKEANKKKVL